MRLTSWRRPLMTSKLATIYLALTASLLSAASDPVKPSTLEELRAAIQTELDEVGHGSIGVALVSKDRTIWTAGIGMANPNTHREADENTYWRLGSITKSFVGLAALILQERGTLRLTDAVADLAPGIGIRNRWETETPVRLAHLLEHTAGFDDLRYKDYASNDPTPLSLRQGIDHVGGSLYSRWPPGLHFSYSNAGPAVAAYIVQQLDSRPFEEFLKQEILEPLEMTGAGLLLTDDLEARMATGYNAEGMRVPYQHIVVRPSGALSATPRQMANFVRMLLNRGSFDGRQLVSPDSIARMERSETTLSGHLQPGYGLGNFPSSEQGFIFRGHNGSMPGHHARYAYLTDQGLGYCVMASVSNNRLVRRVDVLVSEYLVRDLDRPSAPVATAMAPDIDQWTGYYRPATSRSQSMRYVERLFGVARVTRADNVLIVNIGGRAIEFHPISNRVFRHKSRPATTLALVEGPDGTKYVQGEIGSLHMVPGAVVWFERLVAGIAALLMVSSPLWAIVWFPLKLGGKLKGRHIAARVWPLLAVTALSIAISVWIGSTGRGDFAKVVDQLGRPTLAAISFVVLSWMFVLLALQGLISSLRSSPERTGRFARMHSIAVSTACLVVAAYLLYFRAIGYPTWW